MPTALKSPQLWLDYLVPVGREKFRLEEVAKILSADDGQAPVTVRSILNGMESGQLFGNRIPFAPAAGQEQRIRTQWMTRGDVLHALLTTRTGPCATQLQQLCEIADRLPTEALDELIRHIVASRQRRPIAR